MKTIQLTYSLEWFKSRLPSVYPSYDGNELLFFDEESIKKRNNRLMSNYGTVPLDICPSLLGYDGFDEKFPKELRPIKILWNKKELYPVKISWNTFSRWFHEFKLYYWLLNNGGSCKRVYSSATDFYDSEYKPSSTVQLPFGPDRSSYEELDKSFEERGGNVSAITNSCEGKRNIVRCCDNGFFKWICDNIVPSFEIPSEYVGYWNTDRIYYPNVISWISWFEERKGYPSELNKCAESDDCCDCEEYIRRGGEKLLESLKTWFKETNSNILKIKGIIEKVIEEDDKKEDDKEKDLDKKIFPKLFAPHAFCEINVSSCFGKPSLQSILSEEYSTKTDFRHGSYDSTSNTSGGTVVDVDGVSMHFKDDSRPNGGSTFNEEYMEMEYDDSAFEEYLPMYANGNKSSFSVPSGTTDTSGITLEDKLPILLYGVDKDGVKKYGKSKADVIDKFSTKANIERNGKYGWFLIDEELYEVSPIESVEMNGEKIPVFRENGTNTPYVIVGGRDVYAEYDFKSNSYSFSFNGNATFKRNPSQDSFDESGIRCISYNGVIKTFPSTSDTITFSLSNGDTADYKLIDGYSIVDDSIYYIYKGKVTSGDTLDEVDRATINNSANTIVIEAKENDIKISKCNVIRGITSSKLLGLRSFNVMTDDNGNMIEALNTTPTKDTYNYQPLKGSELEPLYQVGNVACISAFSLSYEDYESNKPRPIRHVGNIISSMKFYYADANGDEISNTVTKVGGAITSSLVAIQESTKKATEYKNDDYPMEVVSDNVYCEIVYNIGATIVYDKAKASYSIDGDSGVTYTEIVEFEKVKTEYYLGNDSHSYPIYVYKLRQGDNPTASFTAPINVFYNPKLTSSPIDGMDDYNDNSSITTTYSSIDGMDDYNGLDAYPTFQDAYNIGISSLPIVDSDVNIDRGNNAAFEKHLKIGEVTSLEALENYTNGYFKMMEN